MYKKKNGMIAENKILDTLNEINWDFINVKTNSATHAIHPYPAKFIPQIPHYIISQFSQKGDTVYDPFLGSGTTAVEANIMGRNAIGNDVNELAVLISKVKTTSIKPPLLLQLDNLLNKIHKSIKNYYDGKTKQIKILPIVNLNLWFKDFVITELLHIKKAIEKLENEDLKDFCSIAFSGIIVTVSNQDSDTRYVRVKKNIKRFDVFERFSRQLMKLRRAMISSYEDLAKCNSILKVGDTRFDKIFHENSADLVVTSPPYPNAYDYHLYHKYRLLWLDMDIASLRRNEIGAHADYSKKNGFTEQNFAEDMCKCFLNISKILKKNSYFVLVIGDSILKGRKIANNEILKQLVKKTPFDFVYEFARNLNPTKKSFNPIIGNIKTEKILVFKNNK